MGPPAMSSIPPSTLTYKERIQLARQEPVEYKKLYSHHNQPDVYQRLLGDATGRIERLSQTTSSQASSQASEEEVLPWPDLKPNATTFYSHGTLSGFMSNTSRPGTTKASIRSGLNNSEHRVPVESLPKGLEGRFKQRDPLEYMATVRPQAETTHQTMRMFGTYGSDYQHAQRQGLHIPNACTRPGFHPDVKA